MHVQDIPDQFPGNAANEDAVLVSGEGEYLTLIRRNAAVHAAAVFLQQSGDFLLILSKIQFYDVHEYASLVSEFNYSHYIKNRACGRCRRLYLYRDNGWSAVRYSGEMYRSWGPAKYLSIHRSQVSTLCGDFSANRRIYMFYTIIYPSISR
ncbi:hypothetical protein ACFTAO_32420 [Paenibacillus rhizoplanae]